MIFLAAAARRQAIGATRRAFSTSKSSTTVTSWLETPIDWRIPSALGFAVIGSIQWYHLNTEDQPPTDLLTRLAVEKTTDVENAMASERQMQALRLFPYRIASRVWGVLHDITLPMWARAPVYNAWTRVFDCNLEEMQHPLDSYENLGEFFSRPLKGGARPIDVTETLTSPVDGKVMAVGRTDASSPLPLLEQIKGARYRLDEFLGQVPTFFGSQRKKQQDKTCLYYCVLYLAPGDYHRIHSPADWLVSERRHFPGSLFPVSKRAVKTIPGLFTLNERVVLVGGWKYGFFSLTAVGATNVGSIRLPQIEPQLQTNVSGQGKLVGSCLTKVYQSAHLSSRGDEVAQFKLGSTVVLVFEAPADFEFSIEPDQTIRMGEGIGTLASTAADGEQGSTFPTTVDVIRYARLNSKRFSKEEPTSITTTSSTPSTVVTTEEAEESSTTKSFETDGDRIRDCFQGLGPAYSGKPRAP